MPRPAGGGAKLEVLPGRTVEQGVVCPCLWDHFLPAAPPLQCVHLFGPRASALKSDNPGQEALARNKGQRFTQGI